MTGTTYKRSNGTWAYSIYLGKGENGKDKRLFKGGFETKREADEEKARILAEMKDSQVVKPSPRTLADFMPEWLSQHAERHCAPKTVERYRQLADYFLPALGRVRLADLNALMIERELNRLKDAGGHARNSKKAPRPLSAKTVRHIAGVLSVALTSAVRWKLLKLNAMTAVQLPKVAKKEATALDQDQLAWYLDAARAHCSWMYPILLFAAATGCRRGEILALPWPDINLATGAVRISKSLEQTAEGLRIKEPKNGEPRLISLPALVIDALKAHREEQQKNRDLFGPDYRTDLDLVFCDPAGDYLKPDSVTAKACLLARKAGLKGIGLHSLRHSHGSQLLSAGVPLPTVSKRLGHSSVYVTATVYSHALNRDETAAAEAWDVAMKRALEGDKARQ